MRTTSGDAQIFYDVRGSGPGLVLLHPFPASHGVWLPVAEALSDSYRCLLPDLRGHGESGIGEGPATMEKHAADVARVCDEARLRCAVFAGVSIGGYVLFEFWRLYRERVAALILCCTRAQADGEEGRANRLASAEDVLRRGPTPFLDGMIPRLLGETARRSRPDLVEAARLMMGKMSPEAIAAVQRGMAQRPDSTSTLATIDVPTLILSGEEDTLILAADAQLMQQYIRGSLLRRIPSAGHYAVFEQPQAATAIMREFLATLRLGA
jgi:3-oxoadipate enol-lactonase